MTKNELKETFVGDFYCAENLEHGIINIAHNMIEKGWTKEKRTPQVGDVFVSKDSESYFLVALSNIIIRLNLKQDLYLITFLNEGELEFWVRTTKMIFIKNMRGKSIAEIVREVGL